MRTKNFVRKTTKMNGIIFDFSGEGSFGGIFAIGGFSKDSLGTFRHKNMSIFSKIERNWRCATEASRFLGILQEFK